MGCEAGALFFASCLEQIAVVLEGIEHVIEFVGKKHVLGG
jgi:hypothetical protein